MKESNEPILYCSDCLWIGNNELIELDGKKIEYCPCCGSTKLSVSSFEEWDNLFCNKYQLGKFININIKDDNNKPLKGIELWKKIMKQDDTIL